MNKSIIKEMVQESIRNSLETKQTIHPLLTESQINEINNVVLEEGVGKAILRLAGMVAGGSVAGNIVGLGGMGVGGVLGVIVGGLGLASSISLAMLGGSLIGAGVGALYGTYLGAKWVYDITDEKKAEKENMKRILGTVDERDKLIQDLVKDLELISTTPSANTKELKRAMKPTIEKTKKIENLTQLMIQYAKAHQVFIREREAQGETSKRFLADKEIVEKALTGKLSALGNKR